MRDPSLLRPVRLVAFGVFATLATSCAPPDATDLSTATQPVIVGRDDLTYVGPAGSVPSRYSGLYPSIGHFRKRDINNQGAHYTGCTASYIGRGVAMTAGHCFDAPTSEARDKLCHGTDVEWALIEGQGPLFRSACQRILRAKDDNAGTDYAFFEVFPPPTRALNLDTSMGKTSPGGGNATLFSHPNNRSLMWSGTCTLTTPYGSIFPHRCDMEGGSSGAPILRDDTLAVVGINLGDDGATLNYGRYLSATPAATVLSERAAWGGVTVTSARTTQRCGAVLQSRDDTYAFIQAYNGLRAVSAGLPASSGCSFVSVSVSYQCAGAGSVYNVGTNDTTRPFVPLSCPSGLTEAPPYWTSFQSEEHGGPATTCDGWTGNHEPILRAIDGVACSGSYCDNVSVRCPGTIRAPITGAPFWTAFFSEEQPARFCPAGSYVTGLRCSGSSCDNISLQCAPSSRPWGTCTQLPAFSEEQVSSTCPSGTHVTGMRCTGRYCDNIALTCC